MENKIGVLNRVICLVAYTIAIYYSLGMDSKRMFGIWKFFTQWNLVVHETFFALCLLCEIFPYLKRKTDNNVRDLIYYGLVFPIGLAVFALFWTIYLYDERLLVPESAKQNFPSWYNHTVHTLIFPGLIIEGLSYKHKFPKKSTSLKILCGYCLAYLLLIIYLGYGHNIWIYPILDVLPLPLKAVFLIISAFAIYIFFLIGEKFHSLIVANTHSKSG